MYRDVDPRPDEPERADLVPGRTRWRPTRAGRRRQTIPATCSPGTSTCRVARHASAWSSGHTGTGSAARRCGRWPPSVRFVSFRPRNCAGPRTVRRCSRRTSDRLRDRGLVRTMPYVVGRERTRLVTLTDQGRAVLEAARRPRDGERRQEFYAGIAKSRELSHDVRVHSAYVQASERLDPERQSRDACRARLRAEARVPSVPASAESADAAAAQGDRNGTRPRLLDGLRSISSRWSTSGCSSRTCASSTSGRTGDETSRTSRS